MCAIFDPKTVLGPIKKDTASILKNVNIVLAVSRGKNEFYKADCCKALMKLFRMIEDKSEKFVEEIWEQIHDFINDNYNNVCSPVAQLKVIHSLAAFYEKSVRINAATPVDIQNLYQNLDRALACVVTKYKKVSEENIYSEYVKLLFLAYESNLLILMTFGMDAYEDFCKMKPSLDMLLHRRRDAYEIKSGLKMYADFIKSTSFKKSNSLQCYSYRYKHKIIPAIMKFLNDERFDIIDAACRLILTVVNHGGPIFRFEMELVLPELMKLVSKYNDCMFCERLFKEKNYTITKEDWPKKTRKVAKTLADTANRIVKFYDIKIDGVQGMEFLIYSILLCNTEKDWEKVYNVSQNMFRCFEFKSNTSFTMIWKVASIFLTKLIQEDCFVEMLMVGTHILKKLSWIFAYNIKDNTEEQNNAVKMFYEKMEELLKKYKTSINNKDEKEFDKKMNKFEMVLINIYQTHKSIYEKKGVKLIFPHLIKLLAECEYMLNINRYSCEHKLVILLHTDAIDHVAENNSKLLKYKDRIMNIALKILAQEDNYCSFEAMGLFGKLAEFGNKCYEEECKLALPLIAKLLKVSNVCSLEMRLIISAAKFRELAAATMAKIMKRYQFKGENEVLRQWLHSFPVVLNSKDSEISYELLLKYIRENNRIILGSNNKNMAQIITVFCYAIRFDAFEKNSTVLKNIEILMREVVVCCSGIQYNHLMMNLTEETKRIIANSIRNAPKTYKI